MMTAVDACSVNKAGNEWALDIATPELMYDDPVLCK
jgi:hypothetical protein